MRPISENAVIQIEITNGCILACANCTRHVGHHRKPFMMTLEEVKTSILSLEGFPGRVGLMGGEPAMHPQFSEILRLYRRLIPDKRRREFWTMGWRWYEFIEEIQATFDEDLIHYNDHTQHTGKHQPLLVAIEDVVADAALREELIDNCPFQLHWSASITPRGAFFCEIAASLDHLFDGPGGWTVEPGWWDRIPDDYVEQRNFACNKCSGALPLPGASDARGGRDYDDNIDVVSPGNLVLLQAVGSPKIMRGQYRVYDEALDRERISKEDWNPRAFRDFEAHNPDDVKKALEHAS